MSSALLEPPFLLFEDHLAPSSAPMSRLYHQPRRVLEARRIDELADMLADADRARAQGFHVAGFLSYEAAGAFEPALTDVLAMPADDDPPLAWFAVFDDVRLLVRAERDALFEEAAGGTFRPARLSERQASLDGREYRRRFAAIQQALARGEVYQINFTFPIEWRFEGDPRAFYRRLADAQPVAHAAFLDTGAHSILSLSPELFVAGQGCHLVARPMKGTAPRGRHPTADRRIARALARDPKSRAENLMIVDLLRNDLSRLARPGGVRVEELFTVERYPSLHQMTSSILAECRESPSLSALMAALFPCGSVTGAPKLRAMEWIARLEGRPRGVYTGAIGFAEPDAGSGESEGGSRLRFNVAIRTLVIDRQARARMGVGSGIVADSRAGDEHAECLLKAAFVEEVAEPRPVFDLIETFRWTPDEGWRRRDAHLDRMRASAAHLGFAFPEERIRSRLEACARRFLAVGTAQRVR
ncbi:MAG: aminodeoxychorismate synthase component I, partial [Alphaproteobacteria bacterium]